MLEIKIFTFNPLAEHTYVVYDKKTRECAIIDPGCSTKVEQQQLHHFILTNNLQVVHLINTHCHIDHIVGNAYVKRTYGVALALHPAEKEILALGPIHGPRYGIEGYEPATPDLLLGSGQLIPIGAHVLHILYTPGHSPGHIALYSPVGQFCIVGDTLFKGYIGRTDLPGGDPTTLLKSIHEQLFVLDDAVVLYPGHGPATTVGHEKRHNPFCHL
jgi:hydroxyacylglutathione hydrolase